VVRVLGVAVGIRAGDEAAAARLRHQWARALTDEATDLFVDAGALADLDPDGHDYAVTIRVTMQALEATAGTRLNIHAGAVADADGRALAVIGESGSGKTTAIRALAQRLGYLSDETVSLTSDLVVHPHPKPLSVITDPAAPGRKQSVSPDDAGLQTPPDHAMLRRVVLLRRGDDASGLVSISTPAAIAEIVPQTSSLVLLEAPLLTLSKAIDRCGGAFALHYSEIDDHLDELVQLLNSDVCEPSTLVHHGSAQLPAATAGQWSRSPWLDAVQYGDELVVMVGSTAVLLAGLGTTVWLRLARPATTAELVAEAEAVHGPHPDATALVEKAMADLTEQGLVSAPALPFPGMPD
jgi:energy-coupling factor transporter ATP-binding protein EcfA2